MFCTEKHSFCLLCCVTTRARAFVSSTDPTSSCVCVSLPTIQVSSSWGMTNCSTDRRSRRSARTRGGNSRPGIRGWRISGSLHELAACCGTKLVQAFTSGVALGGQPSHTTCTVHGPDVSCSRPGEGCGHSIRDYKWALQHGELHRIWGPSMPAVATNSASRVVGSARDRCRST